MLPKLGMLPLVKRSDWAQETRTSYAGRAALLRGNSPCFELCVAVAWAVRVEEVAYHDRRQKLVSGSTVRETAA